MRKWIRKLLFATSYRRLLFTGIVAGAACLMAYFAQDIVFYDADTAATAYQIEVITTTDVLPEKTWIDIDYDGDTIRFVTDGQTEPEDITVYGATRFGTAKLSEENMAQLDEVFLGTFAAACPKQSYDIDEDGQNENVYFFVKTDLRSIQPNSGLTPLMRDKNVGMEIAMDSFERLVVYYQTKPLAERDVTVYLMDGTSFSCTTDSSGYLPQMTVKQMRAGVTVEYAPNGLNTYITRYVPETNRIISDALMPAVVVFLLAVTVIVLCVLMREASRRRSGRKSYGRSKAGRRTYKPGFVIVRWLIMLVSFALLAWGGSCLGYWFEELLFRYYPAVNTIQNRL